MKKKVKKLLVCNSNMFIPTILTEVLGHPQEHYLIISDTRNIVHFFNFLKLSNIDFLDYGGIGENIVSFRKKHILLSQIGQYEIGQLVFFHAEFGGVVNWLIKKMSISIPIKYCKLYDKMPLPPLKSFFKVLKIKIKQRIYWDMNVDVLDRGRPILSLPDSFFSEVRADFIEMPVNVELVSKYVSEKLSVNNIHSKYLLLTGTVVSVNLCPKNLYEQLINNVIDVLGTNNTVSKCHPRFKNLYGNEKKLRQIPSFIPGNVLINNYDFYIGFESTLLVEAAIAGKKSISLIYILPIADNLKQQWYDFFTSRLQGKGSIIYPKSVEELKTIIN